MTSHVFFSVLAHVASSPGPSEFLLEPLESRRVLATIGSRRSMSRCCRRVYQPAKAITQADDNGEEDTMSFPRAPTYRRG